LHPPKKLKISRRARKEHQRTPEHILSTWQTQNYRRWSGKRPALGSDAQAVCLGAEQVFCNPEHHCRCDPLGRGNLAADRWYVSQQVAVYSRHMTVCCLLRSRLRQFNVHAAEKIPSGREYRYADHLRHTRRVEEFRAEEPSLLCRFKKREEKYFCSALPCISRFSWADRIVRMIDNVFGNF